MLAIRNGYLLLLLLVCSVGCAGSQAPAVTSEELSASLDLPPPSEFNIRSASFVNALNGSDFDTVYLEPRHVTGAGVHGLFEPPGGATGFGFAMYFFQISAGSGPATLSYDWTPPPMSGQLWIALSDWDLDSWVWFAANPESDLDIDEIEPHRGATGELLALVLITSAGAYNLETLYFEEDPPVVTSAGPTAGRPDSARGFYVTADGLEPFTYDWDFGGGAAPNESTERAPGVVLGAEGTYSASVAVSNYFGSDVYEFDLVVQDVVVPGTGELVAVAAEGTAGVGEPVQIIVSCGDFPHPFLNMAQVSVTVEEGAEYVDDSFNAGAPGGLPGHPDGIWQHVLPNMLLIPPDTLYAEAPVDAEPGLVFIGFSVFPIGGTTTYEGGDLFNFELSFAAAGTYTLGFLDFQGVDRTYYSDDESNPYFWNNITNAHEMNTIVVSE